MARNCPSNPSNPSNLANGSAIILAASNPSSPSNLANWFCHTGRWRRSKTSHLLDCGPWALCAGRWRRSKTSHLLDCGCWALCETVGGVAQTVGSGRAKSLFSSGPKLPFKPLKPLETCQWFFHTGRYTGRWSSQLLSLTVSGLAQTVGSGLWRAKSFFLVARNCPSNPFKPLQTPQTHQSPQTPQTPRNLPMVLPYTGRWSSQLLDSGRDSLQSLNGEGSAPMCRGRRHPGASPFYILNCTSSFTLRS